MNFYSLDHYIAKYGHALPQIVRVGKGFCGTLTNQVVQTGEVLIIYEIESNRKILARDIRGREICLPRTCNWKVEIVAEHSEREYDKLSKVPTRYLRVLQDIPGFDLVAGDTLLFTEQLPHPSKARKIRCRLVSSSERVYINFPADLKGRFEALPNYQLLHMDQVLKEFSLPVNGRLVPEGQTTYCSEQVTLSIEKLGNVQIEREIEEATVFAIPARNTNYILTFPTTLDIFITQCTTQQEFLSHNETEYQQLLSAIANDKLLQNMLNTERVYFTNEPVRWYSLMKFLPFCFEKKESQIIATTESGVTVRQQRKQSTEEQNLEFSSQQQRGAISSEGIRPLGYSEEQAPPLPPKMTMTSAKYQVASEKERDHNTERRQESETHEKSWQIRGKHQAQNVHQDQCLFMHRDTGQKSKTETTRAFKSMPRLRGTTRMQVADDNFSESEEAVFSAREPQLDVNANLAVNTGIDNAVVRKGTLPSYFQTEQPSCNASRIGQWQELNTVSTRHGTDRARYKEHAINKYSAPSAEKHTRDERNGTQLLPEPLVRKQHETLHDVSVVTNTEPLSKEYKMNKYSHCEPCTEQTLSGEDKRENHHYDILDVHFHEKQEDGRASDTTQMDEFENNATTECVHQDGGDTEVSSEKVCVNGDSGKKGLFQSLTRRPRWFRQDASKPGKKEKRQVPKERSEPVRVPLRNATSCEDLWISSPQEDDFECMESITKYLETKEKLTRALVKIKHLEMQTSKPVDTMASVPENTIELPISKEEGPGREQKVWKDAVEPQLGDQRSQAIPSKQRSDESCSTFKDPSTSSMSVAEGPVSNQGGKTWQNRNQSDASENGQSEIFLDETNSRRLAMPYNTHASTSSYDDSDLGYEPSLPVYGPQRDNVHFARHGKEHCITRDTDGKEMHLQDGHEACSCSRNAQFESVLFKSRAKHELKKAILQEQWSEEEWMELSESVIWKISHRKRSDVPYVNLPPYGRRASLPEHQTVVDNSSNAERNRKQGMPPYVNLNQGNGIPGRPPHGSNGEQERQEYLNNLQRLANRSLRKPPVPTPRSGRCSV